MSINDHSLYLCSMLLKTSFLKISLKKDKYRNYWVLINAFWIRLRFVKYRFVRYRFVRYWFRFLGRPWINTDILVNILFISKRSSRRLQRNSFLSSKTSSIRFANTSWRRLQDAFARRLQDVLEDEKLLPWRRVEDVLKTNKFLLGQSVSQSVSQYIQLKRSNL